MTNEKKIACALLAGMICAIVVFAAQLLFIGMQLQRYITELQ